MLFLTNLIGAIALVSGLSSYFMRSQKMMLSVSSGATVIWALYFLLKGAHTAAALVLIAAVRIALGVFVSNWQPKAKRLLTAVILGVVSLCAYGTWAGSVSLPSTLASLFLTVATLNFHYKSLRYALLFGDVLWLWNGFAVDSVLGVLAAMMGLVINGLVLYKESGAHERLQFTRLQHIPV